MNTGITIEGLDDCLRWMDHCPANCLKASRTALREASKKTSAKIRRTAPKRWRRLVKFKVMKSAAGNLIALVGFFNGHQQQGHQNKASAIDDWFKAYWANYGTLTHRDPNHNFREPVKRATARRRNNVGQPRKNFFEQGIVGFNDEFVAAFSDSLAKQERTFYER